MGTLASHERRRALRAQVRGEVVLRRDRKSFRGTIENLSLGGVLLRSRDRLDDTEAPDSVDVELRLPRSRAIALTGEVRRLEVRDGELWVAVRFDPPGADGEDAIEDQVVSAFVAARRRPVVVIEAEDARRDDLAAALRARRMTPLVPRTPLEVIDLLSQGEQRADVCVIGGRFADHEGGELARAIREAFPWVRVVHAADDARAAADDVAAAWDQISAAS